MSHTLGTVRQGSPSCKMEGVWNSNVYCQLPYCSRDIFCHGSRGFHVYRSDDLVKCQVLSTDFLNSQILIMLSWIENLYLLFCNCRTHSVVISLLPLPGVANKVLPSHSCHYQGWQTVLSSHNCHLTAVITILGVANIVLSSHCCHYQGWQT